MPFPKHCNQLRCQTSIFSGLLLTKREKVFFRWNLERIHIKRTKYFLLSRIYLNEESERCFDTMLTYVLRWCAICRGSLQISSRFLHLGAHKKVFLYLWRVNIKWHMHGCFICRKESRNFFSLSHLCFAPRFHICRSVAI